MHADTAGDSVVVRVHRRSSRKRPQGESKGPHGTADGLRVLLISTYEMGRQPFGLASPAAWLRETGAHVDCLDLSVESLRESAVRTADLIAFYVPMHMATRMAVAALSSVKALNPDAHLCFYGLYAAENAEYLRRLGVDSILSGEFETGLVTLAARLADVPAANRRAIQAATCVSRDRQWFLVPDRSGLPDLTRYAHLVTAEGEHLTVGYVEASRGCKHLCRHCPIVPVYGGRFRVVQREVVLEDIRRQVAAGARHITFGDPDFFNGPGHAIPLVEQLHAEHPDLTYDVTIKVQHLVSQAKHLRTLTETGCLFITTAVESFDERILTIFEKHHSKSDLERVLRECRSLGLWLVPTFVAFTPWTTLDGYQRFLDEIVRLELVDHVAPIQYAIRLLIPPGSRLLELPEVDALIGELDYEHLCYTWHNDDPRVDVLQRDLERLVQDGARDGLTRREIFLRIWSRSHRDDYRPPLTPELPARQKFIPYLTEPWYC